MADVHPALTTILDAFVAEALPEGGVERARSLWQAPGRGAAGDGAFEGDIDPRYLRFAAEGLYGWGERLGRQDYLDTALGYARYMARAVKARHPSWAVGNALETIGLAWTHAGPEEALAAAATRLAGALLDRRIAVTTPEGVSFDHIPCGYGVPGAEDAGWTNDLSLAGSGLVWAYEVTGDPAILEAAASFAEFFVQPWHPDSLGSDGYWRCGTWRDDLGSWVVGPAHFSGFESTDAYSDEVSWVFSTESCTDFLMRLFAHRPDPRYLDRCVRAARWVFDEAQFPDGGIGMCGRDDKWLGLTACGITQVALMWPHPPAAPSVRDPLREGARRACEYLRGALSRVPVTEPGVEWVTHATLADPPVNVGMMWAFVPVGCLNWESLA